MRAVPFKGFFSRSCKILTVISNATLLHLVHQGFWGLIPICMLDAVEEDNSLLGWIQDLDADDSHNLVHNLASAASGSCSASQRS